MGRYLSMRHNLSMGHLLSIHKNTVNMSRTYGTSKLTSICIRVNFLAYSLDNYRHISLELNELTIHQNFKVRLLKRQQTIFRLRWACCRRGGDPDAQDHSSSSIRLLVGICKIVD